MPQINRSKLDGGALHERPVVDGALRVLSVLAGLGTAAVAFVVVGLYAALQNCEGGETTGLCVHQAGLVPVLELPIFVIAFAAPLIGGIATGVTKRGRWLAGGIVLALVMFAAMSLVSTGQTPYDWN
jgi:hypothetical protein